MAPDFAFAAAEAGHLFVASDGFPQIKAGAGGHDGDSTAGIAHLKLWHTLGIVIAESGFGLSCFTVPRAARSLFAFLVHHVTKGDARRIAVGCAEQRLRFGNAGDFDRSANGQ